VNGIGSTRVLLVRHGRTAVNAQGRLSGRHDPRLDDVGRAQAVRTAGAVRTVVGESPDGGVLVVSSPLRRCLETAETVAQALGSPAEGPLPVVADPSFVEMDYGEWDGRPLADVPVEAWQRWRTDPGFRPPDGETLAEVTARVAHGLAQWVERTPGGTVVVVSHVSPIKAAVVTALGVGDETTWRMRLDNASLTRLESAGGRFTLRTFNEVGHLGGGPG